MSTSVVRPPPPGYRYRITVTLTISRYRQTTSDHSTLDGSTSRQCHVPGSVHQSTRITRSENTVSTLNTDRATVALSNDVNQRFSTFLYSHTTV